MFSKPNPQPTPHRRAFRPVKHKFCKCRPSTEPRARAHSDERRITHRQPPTHRRSNRRIHGVHMGHWGAGRWMCLGQIWRCARVAAAESIEAHASIDAQRLALMPTRAPTVPVAITVTADTAQPPNSCCGPGSALGGLAPSLVKCGAAVCVAVRSVGRPGSQWQRLRRTESAHGEPFHHSCARGRCEARDTTHGG